MAQPETVDEFDQESDEWKALERFVESFGKTSISDMDGDGIFTDDRNVAMLVADEDRASEIMFDLGEIETPAGTVAWVPETSDFAPERFRGSTMVVTDDSETFLAERVVASVERFTGTSLERLNKDGLVYVHPEGHQPVRIDLEPFTLVLSPLKDGGE